MQQTQPKYRFTGKEIIIYYVPDEEKKEWEDFLGVLSTVKGKKAYNNKIDKNKYKNILEQHPEFTIEWLEQNENNNNKFDFENFLNKPTQVQENSRIYKILKKFPKSEKLTINQINDEITAIGKSREREDIDKQKQKEIDEAKQAEAERRDKEKKEALDKQEKQLTEQAEKDKRNIKAESYQNANDKLAKYKNENEELKEENKRLREENQYKVNPRLKDYLRDHYIIDSPMTREELYEKVANDPHLLATNENHINKYVDYILGKQLRRLIMSKTKIIKTAKLFGNDAEYLNKLDPSVREAVLKYQTDYINKVITDKNNKYLLPKKYIKFEKAINNYKVNPLILRGLYVK